MFERMLPILLEGWGWMLLKGASMTLFIAIFGMLLGTIIGIAGASIRLYGPRPLGWLVRLYTTVTRSIPELLIIYLIFFGSVHSATDLAYLLDIDEAFNRWFPALVGILAIGVIAGSYSVEVFRGAFTAIPRGQIEAAQAIGMSRWVRFWRITLPQLFWYALPGSNNVWQTALKDTALISLVGLVEIMRAAQLGAAATREPLLFYLCAGALFFLIGVGSQAFFTAAERFAGHGLRNAP